MQPTSVQHFDYLVQAVKRAGPRKLLFGSDGPWLHTGVELNKIRLLGLPKDAQALVLGGNALRLIRADRVEGERPLIVRAVASAKPHVEAWVTSPCPPAWMSSDGLL